MSDVRIDQVEFRWRPKYDLSAIASSFDDTREQARWNDILQSHAGVSSVDRAVPIAPASAVYLTFKGENAALILRSSNEGALDLYQATEDRKALVARALIGPMEALTPALAIRLAAGDLRDVLVPAPGQVDFDAPLPPLGTNLLWRAAAADHALRQRAQQEPGLAPLVSAVLRDPAQPVTMLLKQEQAGCNLHESPAIYLLWALYKLVGSLLIGDDGRPLEGWKPTFSTFEAPFRGGDGRPTPRVAFRVRPKFGNPPLHEAPKVAHDNSPLSESDLVDAAALRLAQLYEVHGDESDRVIAKVIHHAAGLTERLTALVYSDEVAGLLGRPREPMTARPAPSKPNGPPVPGPVQSPVQSSAPNPASVSAPAPAAQVEPNFVAAIPADHSGSTDISGPSVPDPYLGRLYARLRVARDPADFAAVMTWISAKARRRQELSREDCVAVWKIMLERHWFTKEIAGMHAAPERMADLLYPLFAALIGDPALETKLQRWHRETPPHPLLPAAIGILSVRLDPDRADWLEQHSLPFLVSPARAASGRRGDHFDKAEREADGSGTRPDFTPAEVLGSLLRDLLRLPSRWLPAGLADALVWFALLEAVFLVLLFRS